MQRAGYPEKAELARGRLAGLAGVALGPPVATEGGEKTQCRPKSSTQVKELGKR